jgi:hypothetical protein
MTALTRPLRHAQTSRNLAGAARRPRLGRTLLPAAV